MTLIIKLVKVSAVLHNLFVGTHAVPKSWLSADDILDSEFRFNDNEIINPNIYITPGLHGQATCWEEVHNFLSALLQ
jgi:hypothetical protein